MSMIKREFEVRSEFVPGANPVPSFRIRCSRCPDHEKISATNGKAIPGEVIVKRFEAKGWRVSEKSVAHDICPKCLAGEQSARKEAALKNAVQPTVSTLAAPRADPPEPMTREDKRVIFAKLNEVYVDEKTGYGPGWADGRVASDLGVPLAWVLTIREENFGPDASNEEIRGLVKQAQACSDDVKKHVDTIAYLGEQIRKLQEAVPALTMQSNRIDGHLARIAKTMGIA